MIETNPIRCLVLACGNTLRSDDGIGPRLAEWAAERFQQDTRVRVIARQQWTPDLAAEIAAAESVLFLDSSIESAPGRVELTPVAPHEDGSNAFSHHLDAPQLLGLARALYGSTAANAVLLTVGAGSTELGECFSEPVATAFSQTCDELENALRTFLAK